MKDPLCPSSVSYTHLYTRRDKPVGRKQVLTAPPVKEVALEHGTPVFQPRTLRDGSEDDTCLLYTSRCV